MSRLTWGFAYLSRRWRAATKERGQLERSLCATCILGTNLICQRLGIVPSLTRQLFIRPEYEKVHTIYQRFSYTRDVLIVDKYSNRPE